MQGHAAFRCRTADTALGPIRLVASDSGLCAVQLPDSRRTPEWLTGAQPSEDDGLAEAERQLREYLSGERTEFRLSLDLRGTAFQTAVWRWLLTVPYGQRRSYAQATAAMGMDPGFARAVASAAASNPLPIVVPCHRLVGSDGSLTGYVGGLEAKRFLLDLESGAARLGL